MQAVDGDVVELERAAQKQDLQPADVHGPVDVLRRGPLRPALERGTEVDGQRAHDRRGHHGHEDRERAHHGMLPALARRLWRRGVVRRRLRWGGLVIQQ
jgi:hypothetical protein